VAEDGVTGNRLSEDRLLGLRRTQQSTFETAVLVAEADFEKEHFLTVALKTKMPGFDNASVHGSYSNLVNAGSVDAVERKAWQRRTIVAGSVSMTPHRLQPRVPFDLDGMFFPQLAPNMLACGSSGVSEGKGVPARYGAAIG
jgi:hypothetical protein